MAKELGAMVGGALGLCLLVTSTAAQAEGFTTDWHQRWVDEMHALVAATHGEAGNMAASCKGLGSLGAAGADWRKEYFQVPKWAFMARFRTCGAFNTIATSGQGAFHKNAGDVCKTMKMALDELAKAKRGVDPDDVVTVAGQLTTELATLLGSYKEDKACRIGG